MGIQHATQSRAHRYHAVAASSFRCAELPVRKRFGNFDCVSPSTRTATPRVDSSARMSATALIQPPHRHCGRPGFFGAHGGHGGHFLHV
jgi:hypothetical protein